MPCYSPLTAYQCSGGEIVFYERAKFDIIKQLQLPCGQCIGCRLERSRQWAMRCMHEASLHKQNAFVTLTYDEEHIPERGQLNYTDFQKFLKRLRKKIAPRGVRFYMCGEYGGTTARPHYHACLFGYDFPDKKYKITTAAGEKIYESEQLTKTWGHGHCSTANVTFESAAYVARYCVQKITGFNAEAHYRREDEKGIYQQEPEFNSMSLKPGIGKAWYEKFTADVHTHDYVIVNGHESKPPKYYDEILKIKNPDQYEKIKEQRIQEANKHREDNTDERLKVKQQVKQAQINQLKRNTI